MPREVKAWACEWGCGVKVATVKSRMVDHEQRCNMNPTRKACPTCEHNAEEYCDERGYIWYCEIDQLPEKDQYGKPIKLVYDCDHWKPAGGEG